MMSIMVVTSVLKIRYFHIQLQTEMDIGSIKVIVMIAQDTHQDINAQKVKIV